MPTQQEEKLQNEFMHFWDNLKKTVNIGDYSDEITNWWIKKISLAVAQREKEIFRKIKDYDFKENHLCGFNDGEQDCKCFIAGLNVALSLITKTNDK